MVFELNIRALCARAEQDKIVITLADGREISFPVSANRKLRAATPAQRANLELICGGTGLHWPDLDEDLAVLGILDN
jgi:hypothetical protein